jgi:hypothetical protein
MRSLDDRSLSFFALAVVAMLGWPTLRGGTDSITASRPRLIAPPLDARVARIATAIATAEGYYVTGPHGGRSLPYFLNNPGALKRTPIDDGTLPTWGDTGLLMFPSHEMGWTALRYQVCMMLTGTSRIYELTDTLHYVGEKYADGDVHWGPNVAAHLGVSPHARLADLADGASTPIAPDSCFDVAGREPRGTHGSHADLVH